MHNIETAKNRDTTHIIEIFFRIIPHFYENTCQASGDCSRSHPRISAARLRNLGSPTSARLSESARIFLAGDNIY